MTIEEAEPIPATVATSVLRLVQESVTNARRHAAGAREIAVTVLAADGLVRVTVRDDGRPGAQPKRYGGGFGLVGMRERVQLLGGRFAAGREPDGGWQVTAELPRERQPSNADDGGRS
ncbi:sensor histidine kinase [Actinoplanes palleronii]|uniref:sensor histidine kinase n=1 Tax=Actinoplanes palleronii TaxID=113570 RepID=UPI0019454B9A|nr:ATP-binding protein [Actinoplanes palleronii]